MSPRSVLTRALLLLAFASSASCGKINIPDGALICGNGKADGGTACPPGFTCLLSDHRCHFISDSGTPSDHSDAKVEHSTEAGGDGPSTAEGGGSACPALDNPTGGTVSAPDLTTGSTATYACTVGGKLVGAATRACQADGTWDRQRADVLGERLRPAHGADERRGVGAPRRRSARWRRTRATLGSGRRARRRAPARPTGGTGCSRPASSPIAPRSRGPRVAAWSLRC